MPAASASAVERFLPRTGLVAAIRAEPALGLLERHALSGRIVLDLVAREPTHGEVPSERVREVDAADSRGLRHRVRLGQGGAGRPLGAEQVEELALLGVVRASRIAECGPDAAEALRRELLTREVLLGLVPLAPHALVQILRERLGEAVGE